MLSKILEITARYKLAQETLIRTIAQQEARGNVTTYRKKILENVNAELSALDKFAIAWANGTLPLEYMAAAEGVWRYLEKEIPASLVQRSEKALEIIIRNCVGDLTDATQYVGRVVRDEVRRAGLEATALKLSSGDTIRQMQKNLVRMMTDRGIVAIRDRAGREIRLDSYAEMVSRTTVRECTNLATINENLEAGNDLVQMTSHAGACPLCLPYEGRVFSISGKDKRYPPLDSVFPGGFHTIHPRCAHSVTPYVEMFDRNARETRKFSNRPFDPASPEAQRQLDAYRRDQAVKTDRRNDRYQWERYKTTLPEDTPKTFSAFRSMKKANSERYRNLLGKYRSERSG